MEVCEEFIRRAGSVRPSARQLSWFDTEFYAFVHFTVNTYTGKEWGDGTESPAIFNPVELDCDEWVRVIKQAGMKGLVLTAKHHDGFCLWPSAYTEHCIKNSPYKNGKGDIVREAAEACRRGGIRFGVYLSPWDRNCAVYGTPAYNDYYANQLTELLTNYGELFVVWQDGACGEGPNGKRQVYDFERFNALVRKYQPNAVIFNDCGPDVRWCGNESGSYRAAEWAVVPTDLCFRAQTQLPGIGILPPLTEIASNNPDLGSTTDLLAAKGVCFAGAEVDMSIRPGWFYHPEEEPHTLEQLFHTYLHTVGGNTSFHLNIPPMPNGRFDPRDIQRLQQLGEKIRAAFGSEIPCSYKKLAAFSDGRCVYEITPMEERPVNYVELAEDLTFGQRVEAFELYAQENGGMKAIPTYHGTTIGHKKICEYATGTAPERLYLTVTGTRDTVVLRSIRLY